MIFGIRHKLALKGLDEVGGGETKIRAGRYLECCSMILRDARIFLEGKK
jgi:hypothetical protein